MTIPSAVNYVDYATNGATQFPYGFKILEDTDMRVVLKNNTTLAETVLALTTDFSVTGVGEPTGGNVITVASYPAGSTLKLKRFTDLVQETTYSEHSSFPAKTTENALDKLTMIDQQQQDQIDRCIILPETTAASLLSIEPGSMTANYYLQWNSAATGINSATMTPGAVTEAQIAAIVTAAGATTIPAVGDEFPLYGIAAAALRKITFANIKASLKTYFDTLYNLYVHPNHSGDVTSVADGAQTIAAKAVHISMLADGTDGELITWNAAGNAATVAVGTVGQVLTSGGAGVAPTFQTSSASVTSASIAAIVTTAAATTIPAVADEFLLYDVIGTVLRKITWSNIRASLKTYFDTIYNNYVHPNHSSEVTSVADGAQTITPGSVTLAKLAPLAANSLIGNLTAATVTPVAVPIEAPTANYFLQWNAGATGITKVALEAGATAASATTTEINTGADNNKFITPHNFLLSYHSMRTFCCQIINGASTLTTGDGQAYIPVPTFPSSGYVIWYVAAQLIGAASTSGTPTIQIARGRQPNSTTIHTFVDVLSTPVTIDPNEWNSGLATVPMIVNTANDDIISGDLLRVDIDAAGTGAKGLTIEIGIKFIHV